MLKSNYTLKIENKILTVFQEGKKISTKIRLKKVSTNYER